MNLKEHIVFILNPSSGASRKTAIPQWISEHLDTSRFTYELAYIDENNSGYKLAEKALEKGVNIVVAAGGDGTVNSVMRALIHGNATLGVIPLGSGNGLARHLHIPLNAIDAIERINNGKTETIDTLEVNGIPYISIAGVGFDAIIAKRFQNTHIRGFVGYAHHSFWEYLVYPPKKYTLKFNGQKIKTRALMITFANSNQFGYGLEIAPKASLKDGLMDVVIVRKPSFWRSPFEAIRFVMKKPEDSPYLQYYQTASLKLKQNKPNYVNVDGEAVWMSRDLHFLVNPKSLKIIH